MDLEAVSLKLMYNRNFGELFKRQVQRAGGQPGHCVTGSTVNVSLDRRNLEFVETCGLQNPLKLFFTRQRRSMVLIERLFIVLISLTQ